MSSAAELLKDPELLKTEWDLSALVDGDAETGVERQLDEAAQRAGAFAQAHAGRLGELDAAGLEAAMRELAEISELVGKAGSYASLRFSTDTADPARGAMLQLVQERATEIETKLLFFDLEWAALPDEQPTRCSPTHRSTSPGTICAAPGATDPHLLSEPEEKILAEKAIASSSAWSRLFGEQVAALRVALDGEELSLEVALSRLQSPDRALRATAAEAVSASLAPGLRTRAFIYNTLLHDKAVDDRLRSLPELAGQPQPCQRGVR